MEKKHVDVVTGIEYSVVLFEETASCDNCPLLEDGQGCEAQPYPDIFHVKTGNVYPTLQQGVDELIDYLSSLPPFPGDGEKEEVIRKFSHLKSKKD